jgi:hypothetical protein
MKFWIVVTIALLIAWNAEMGPKVLRILNPVTEVQSTVVKQPIAAEQPADIKVVVVGSTPADDHKTEGFLTHFGMFFVGLATGYLLTIPGLIGLFILGILFEHNDAGGWSIFTALATIIASYFFFSIPLTLVVYYLCGYVAIGVVWSFYRYKRYITEQAQMIRNSNDTAPLKLYKAQQLHPSKQLDTITVWIISWPFSAIDNLVGDLINSIQTLVTTVFKNIYYKIYSSVMGDLINIEEDNKK